jgi:membrane protein YdbS with pleckstrin-like domain
MVTQTGYRRRSGVARLIGILLIVWLIIGAIAAGQRHYYSSAKSNCASVATTTVTILAGPLNYVGVNPKVHCPTAPQPSK